METVLSPLRSANVTLGKHSNLAQTGSDISANVTIGAYTSIGPYVSMHTRHDHACIENPRLVSTLQHPNYPHTRSREKITIGNDVWIGRNAVLLGGITIGDGAIVGAYSVVSKDVPPYAIVVGNPAIVKRYRFLPSQIEALLRIKWWDSEVNPSELMDIDAFLKKYDVV